MVVLIISFTIVFFLLRILPGNPVETYVEMLRSRGVPATFGTQPGAASTIIETFIREYGLEKDPLTQYQLFIYRLFYNGTLGPSFVAFPTPVEVLIYRNLPWSIFLLGLAATISWIIGILAGTLIGWKHGSKIDTGVFTIALVFSQIPYYLLAIILLLLLAYIVPLFPGRGAYSPLLTPKFNIEFILDVLYRATLPALSIIIISACGWLISTRSLVITTLGEDYLLLATAKGLTKHRILTRYVLRNILLPQTTGLALSLGFIVTGSFLVEWIFNYPGIGSLFVLAISLHDFNTIQGIILLTMVSVLSANFLLELIYPLIDPRVALERR